MSDRVYRYHGPPSGVTLRDGREILFFPGRELTLSSEHPYVRRLVARGLLTANEPDRTKSDPVKQNRRPQRFSSAAPTVPREEPGDFTTGGESEKGSE